MNPKSLLRNILLGLSATMVAVPPMALMSAQSATAQTPVKNKPLHSKTRTAPKKSAQKSQSGKVASGNAASGKAASGKAVASKGKTAPAKQSSSDSRYRALKINVPYAAAVVQNLAFEWQVAKKVSVDIPLMWSFSDLTSNHGVRTVAIQPEVRWWPGANPGNGHFLGANVGAAWFNVRWNDYRYQADTLPLLTAGISYGYHLPIAGPWQVEFNIGAGYAYMEYDRFFNIDNGAKIDRQSRHYFGITRLGVSLVYNF